MGVFERFYGGEFFYQLIEENVFSRSLQSYILAYTTVWTIFKTGSFEALQGKRQNQSSIGKVMHRKSSIVF